MKLKRYKKKKFSRYISRGITIIVISLVCSFFVIDYFARKSNEILLPMAESKVRKVVTMIINSACDEVMIGDNLYEINKDSNDEIKLVTYNSFEVTKLINEVTANIELKLKDFENNEIDYYVTHYRPLDKAGAYGIQEWIGYIGVTALSGSYFNVMGLPIQRLYNELKQW